MPGVTEVRAKRRGRPPLGRDVGKRAPLSLRTTKQLKRMLDDRSNETGRSIAQEVEYCLEAWLTFEQGLGGKRMVALFRLLASTAMLIEGELGRGPTMTDYHTFAAVEEAWKQIIRNAGPVPDAETVEGLADLRRLVDDAPQRPPYPKLPVPDYPSGFGQFVSAETRAKREALHDEWQQRHAQWQALAAEHQQKVEAALGKFERYKEIGREVGQRAVDRYDASEALALAERVDHAKHNPKKASPES